jgi:hypothetical protein
MVLQPVRNLALVDPFAGTGRAAGTPDAGADSAGVTVFADGSRRRRIRPVIALALAAAGLTRRARR